jgi:hydrogenase expression/formation protein HypC
MCLAVPGRIVACDADQAMADLHGNRVPVSILFAPDVTVGDWVLIHAGFVIQRLEAEAARRSWALLADLVENEARGTATGGAEGSGP